MTGFNIAARAATCPGDGLLVQTPVYFPFFRVPRNIHLVMNEMELTRRDDGQYEVDFDLFEEAITGRTCIFLLCNPHNPVGRVFTRDELERMAEICLRHDVVICSDEIHCDLVFPGHQHLPIASLSPEIARQTITLHGAQQDLQHRRHPCFGWHHQRSENCASDSRPPGPAWSRASASWAMPPCCAAYRDGQPWLEQVLAYMQANRDYLLRLCG